MTTAPTLKYNFERSELLAFVPDDVHALLDIGCGSGAFGRLLRSRRPGIELWAIEPDETSARAAKQGFDRVIIGEFPTDQDLGRKFDVIVCADVLEHMPRPEQALRAAVSITTHSGIMIASIPNVRHWRGVLWPLLGHGRWTYTERGILDHTHLKFFTRRSMKGFFANNGWSIESITGIGMIRREKLLSIASMRLTDDFLYPQYVVVARLQRTVL